MVNKTFSDPLPVSVELHKVWVTAQLFFKMYINDIVSKVDDTTDINLFADDTNIFS